VPNRPDPMHDPMNVTITAPTDLSIPALRAAYAAKALTPPAVVRECLARIEVCADNPIWIHRVPRAQVLARAEALERLSPAERARLPLYGIPFALKDNIDAEGMPTTAACPEYSYSPARSSTVASKLLDAGAILMGKTNLDQFATGLVGTRSPYGACRNAFDERYISGGSSSGSAVAVAKGLVSFALGTDTAGSGRIPAAFNNVVGLKPTRGLVSTTGVVPACRSLDCVSVFAMTCADAGAVLGVIAGFDAADPFSRPKQEEAAFSPTNFRFAVPKADQLEFFGDTGYAQLFEAAIRNLAGIGGEIVEIDLAPFLAVQDLLYGGPWVAERLAALETFLAEKPAAFHPVTRQITESGRRFSAVDAYRGLYRLAELKRECEAVWKAADVMLVPAAPTVYTIAEVEANPVELNSRLGLYTNFVNLLDLAALSVPAGFRSDRLPFGVTLIGPAFSDHSLAELGARFNGERVKPVPGASQVRVAVVGAHLSGMPLNHQLTERGARMVRSTRTAPGYRLYALDDTLPPKPALVRSGDGHGSCIDVEVWEMPMHKFGSFVAEIPSPLGIGTLSLADGEPVKGFLCEAYAIDGKPEITSFGGWRNYLRSVAAPSPKPHS